MSDSVRTYSVNEARGRMGCAHCALIDVREYPEYVEAHVEGARLIPLGDLVRNPKLAGEAGEALLICRTDRRAREAARVLREYGLVEPVVVVGGMEAWKRAHYPVTKSNGPIALERQVRIAAGSLVLLGILVPHLGFVPYLIGAGLVFAGVTNSCAMGLLLARLPWNRPRQRAAGCAVGSPAPAVRGQDRRAA